MPKLGTVVETSLYVADLDRSEHFYRGLFGLEKLVGDDRFRALNVAGQQVLLLFLHGATLAPMATPLGVIPPHDGHGNLHLAFRVAEADYEEWRAALDSRGIAIESEVHWERGGRSLYFRDPDGHLVELITPGCWATY